MTPEERYNELTPKKKLLISFSGGRTSAYMTWWLMNEWKEREEWEMVVVFANTGKEVEGTLEFVDRCSKEWGIDIVWVEAVPVKSKKDGWWGVKHRIVDFRTASRKGEPFEAMLSKLGIPCSEAPFCSDQLKRKAIESYLKSIKWKGYYKAIGIRADEVDRINENFRKKKIIYPLIRHNPVSKNMVLDWWKNNSFDLKIDFDLGNCDGCWKKSMMRLTSIAKRHPYVYNWWQEMTDRYSGNKSRDGVSANENHNFYWINYGTNGVVIVKFSEHYNKFCYEIAKGHSLVLDYVHDLQNAFYVNTKKHELTIKTE